MKKIKNKLFYVYSLLLYFILAAAAFVLSVMFLELDVRSFFISKFAAIIPGVSNNAVVIVYDQTSQNKLGKFQTKYIAELLDYFYTYNKNPKVIGVDAMIDFEPVPELLNLINKSDNIVLGFTPAQHTTEKQNPDYIKKFALNVTNNSVNFDTKLTGISKIHKSVLDKSKNIASVAIHNEKDKGTVFASTNIVKINDNYFASLPLKMFMVANKTNELSINEDYIIIDKLNLKIPHNRIKENIIQTNLRYYAPTIGAKGVKRDYTHLEISAYDIITLYRKLKTGQKLTEREKNLHNNIFNQNSAIFIGEFTDGPSTDFLISPLSSRHPGVDVQATTYSNIENNEYIYNIGILGKLITIFIIGFLTFFCVFRFNFIKSLALVLLIDILFFGISAISACLGCIFDFITPIAIQLVTLIFGYSFKFISENRNKEKIKQAMGKYLSKDIMQNVVSNIDDLKLGGKRAVVTVLFSDIRGFTSLSEKMTAEEVSVILNEYFAEMEPIITKYNGVINKFIGDAVMAIFGEPIQDINHPQNAVKCAYEMLKKVEYLREKWIFEGKPKIEIGVGINTGEVFIGNIGTETRMEYTVIGDTVNLASRIESYNKVYKTNLLVSSSTYSYIADIADVIKINEVQIRGKAKKMNIYEVLRIDKNH